MTHSKRCSYLLFLSASMQSFPVASQDDVFASLFDMSLEELLSTPVTTASKQEESLRNSNASISVVSRQQIEQFGGHSLYEILERIVSVNSNYGVLTTITTRGSKPWTGLLQHLGLLNGRPFGNLSGAHNLYTSIPLSSIERIEYIRGPGSVLYGTNAYQGVFNIITRQGKSEGWQANQSIVVGSFDSQIIDASYVYKNNDLSGAINVLYTDIGGWDAQTFDPTTQTTFSKKAFQTDKTLHLDINYKALSLSHFRNLQQKFGNFWDAPEENYIPWSKLHPSTFTNLSHSYQFDNNWKLDSHYTNIKKEMEWSSEGIADDFIRIKSPLNIRLLEFNLSGDLSDNASLLVGAYHEHRRVYAASTIPDAKERYASLYAQIKYVVTPKLNVELGGQYVTSVELINNIDNQSDFVPRLGLTYHFNDVWTLKLRHAKAFRHPSSGERTIETPGIQKGTPDLRSETINTTEAQLFYQTDEKLFTATLYKNEEHDLILLRPSDDPNFALENKNSGEISSYGIELEYKHQLTAQWYAELSATHQRNEDKHGTENINLAPNNSFKFGLSYDDSRWQLGMYLLSYSKYHDNILFDPNRELVNPPADGYNWLTVKASRKFIVNDDNQLTVSLEIKNLLDESVYQPNDTPVFYPINTLPAREDLGAFLSVNYQF
ncbi:TonB-dependent receptor [Pseudoalteromonas sp. MMG022]|uniref:TonB-dependent receptor plug domain-containing protein n=1 Tax=Pseudoalteromonas sp. MMG022 TaxID=2909978 RepID=UPI001F2778CB|nr:TonB-dependent receptor [Pseudoalteromonas sp. MMG022]MCF6435449.1 TonB-dependent receptor [Pseudoalteromonas sp. MMG022]